MTTFTQQELVDGLVSEDDGQAQVRSRRPSRWSLKNWPVRWKVFAIVLVPLILAGAFGGLRIYSNATEARDLQRAAERAEMVPAIVSYMNALNGAMLAPSTGGDVQAAIGAFDSSRAELQRRLNDTATDDTPDVPPDVQKGVTSMIEGGQAQVNKIGASVPLFDRITTYEPILLTAQDSITGSVLVDDQRIRAEAQGLASAVGARGQMMMEQLIVTGGADLPDPELRSRLMAVAGTDPSTRFGIAEVLGIGSPEAKQLQREYVHRTALISDPNVPIVGNPEMLQSLGITDQIAAKIIDQRVPSITGAVADRAAAARTEAIRDSAIVIGAIALALLLVILVARSLVRPLRTLRDSALRVAHEDLAREIDRVRAGKEPAPIEPIPVHTTEEIGQVAHAVDELHEQAVFLAGEQSRLRVQVDDMFETLSRRSRSLVDQQLSLIDRLERNEEDPERLDSLFRLDHLAARMRRNGANLLVLAGAKVPREQADAVPVAALINAAASEVEDYARVVTATVPDSEIVGSIAGDLVHLLAELLDNALRYSPPISQVRVSAVHTGNGGLVVEVSDIGLGMTESDLRVANTRLQSGGEVTPYTARHMGLFVVGRLAQQHGLVVRLRSSIAGEPNSGTTAGVYVPAELILRAGMRDQIDTGRQQTPVDAQAGIATALALDDANDYGAKITATTATTATRSARISPTGTPSCRSRCCRNAVPAPAASPVRRSRRTLTTKPSPRRGRSRWQNSPGRRPSTPRRSSRRAAEGSSNGIHEPEPGHESEPQELPQIADAEVSVTAGADDAIYQRMLSEWLVDPTELANTSDLNWESVWDHGWSAAEAAEEAPVESHTEHGLPVRDPGARLVPGAAGAEAHGANGGYANGGAHHGDDDDHESAAEFSTGGHAIPVRDPEAVRASMASHFGGVHAARSHAQETRGTDNE